MDFQKIEKKWQDRWEKARIGEAEPVKGKKAYYIIFAYPGVSGFLHVGHMRGYFYTDLMARYKRLRGYNVLFPVGIHASGMPAIGAAMKVKRKDAPWIDYLKRNGVSAKDIPKLADPVNVIRYFTDSYIGYWKSFGMVMDLRRTTTTINPDYSKFIDWQFRKLNEKGLLVRKEYRSPYCPSCDSPVAVDPSETDISKGGNADITEFTMLKFGTGDKDEYILAATLRPETIYGQTNMWVFPDTEYAKISVAVKNGKSTGAEKETWIVSKPCAEKLKHQMDGVTVTGTVKGKDLVGKTCLAPGIEREIIILPASFAKPDIATGFVTSVPSDAPYDYIALQDLKKDEAACRKYDLDPEKVKRIELISIISSKGFGKHPAKEICERMGITSQNDIAKLEEATSEVYKAGFHTGVMAETCGPYAGMKVEIAKERMKEDLMKKGKAAVMFEFTEPVVCRCGTSVVIKKVPDQWFIKYSDEGLKAKAKECTKQMTVKPEDYYAELPGVVDWFHDRACTRKTGYLGTEFPFKKGWIIEPIADSTLYPIYYLVSMYVNNGQLKPEQMSEAFFDYVFLGRGDAKKVSKETGAPEKLIEKIRADVTYFYPLDMNLGGQEHKTVHFPVFIMNHAAILDKSLWPKGIFANWWVIQKGGEKISKSKGGAEPIPGGLKKYGADGMRLYYAHIGGPHSNIEWDSERALKYRKSVDRFFSMAKKIVKAKRKGKTAESGAGRWMRSRLAETVMSSAKHADNYETRDYAHESFFSLYSDMQWCIRRQGASGLRNILRDWTIMLSPIIPHTCEEVWEMLGEKGFITEAAWPEASSKDVDDTAVKQESLVKKCLEDIGEIRKLIGREPEEARIYVSPKWKYGAYSEALKHKDEPGKIVSVVMQNPEARKQGNWAAKFAQNLAKNARILQPALSQKEEFSALSDAEKFFSKEFGCKVKVLKAEESDSEKAQRAEPSKPGIELL